MNVNNDLGSERFQLFDDYIHLKYKRTMSAVLKLCTPAMVYLVVSVLALAYGVVQQMSAMTLIFKVLLVALWTFLLNWLCAKGYSTLSWIIVLLPVVMIVLLVSLSADLVNKTPKPTSAQSTLVVASSGCSMCNSHP